MTEDIPRNHPFDPKTVHLNDHYEEADTADKTYDLINDPLPRFTDWPLDFYDTSPMRRAFAPAPSAHPPPAPQPSRRSSSYTSPWSDLSGGGGGARAPTQPTPPLSGTTTEARIEYVMACARAASFESLDAALCAYYTTAFAEGSACANAQWLSRRRRLPALLDALRAAAAGWSPWEAQAWQDAVLRAGEAVMVEERRALGVSGGGGVLADVEGLLGAARAGERWGGALRGLQGKLPNLWSLVTAILLDGSGRPDSSYHSRLIVAVVTILCLADHASLEHISQLVASILTV
ncbi:hypothetical protein COCMIDRAFT_26565 [Neofusicoccum parvum]|uniref:Uncharacterized protein n=1 Tax=Neofusicoccum parvum TaxID=310453 RepID=A0ACB5S1H8_9PEZI|nr:hypothetical protein COCMIDRAFT_26565 [Neofusicoccum parvum]